MRILLLMILLMGCLQSPVHEKGKEPFQEPGSGEMRKVTGYIGGAELHLEVALSPEERAIGLMYRESLGEKNGMLFVFEEKGNHAIWMKNVRFPLDLLWLDDEMRVVYVYPDASPCRSDPCPIYIPPEDARYVLELPANFTLRHGIGIGDRLTLETAYRAP